MTPLVITIIGEDDRIISMFNYIFYIGITKANYTDFILKYKDVPEVIKNRTIDYNELKENLFLDLFSIDKHKNNSNDWYDFQLHTCLKAKDISIHNKRIYKEDLFNLTDVSRKLGFPDNYPIIKISELKKIYENVINTLFGNIFLFNLIKKANDISISRDICFIKNINSIEEVNTIKQSFPFTGYVIDITGNSKFNYDYQLPFDLVEHKDINGIYEKEFKLFYHINSIVKFIII